VSFFHQRGGLDKRRRAFLEKFVSEDGICGHFGENTNDTAGDVVGSEVSIVEATEASVDVWEISMDLLEPTPRAKIYTKRLASEEGSLGNDLPGSWRASHRRSMILAQSSALSMSATKVGGVGESEGLGWAFFLGPCLFFFAPGPGILVQVSGVGETRRNTPLNH